MMALSIMCRPRTKGSTHLSFFRSSTPAELSSPASVRPTKDLIAEGFSDEALAERLKRQHRLICAAIHSGRINDLKQNGRPPERGAGSGGQRRLLAEVPEEVEASAPAPVEEPFEIEYWPMTQEWTPPPPAPPPEETG